MAKVKANVSFAGVVTMGLGETKDIEDKAVLKDLLSAGYVEEVKSKASSEDTAKKSTKKG